MPREIIEAEGGGASDGDEYDMEGVSSGSESDDGEAQVAVGRKALLGLKKSATISSSKKTDAATTVKNRQRVLILSSRGIIHRFRHLLKDLSTLMPHSRLENKLDTKQNLRVINELAELSNCNNAIFFEVRKHKDLYMWLAKTPNGPSVKFHVQNSISRFFGLPL